MSKYLSRNERKEVKKIVRDTVGLPEIKYSDLLEAKYNVPSVLGAAQVLGAVVGGSGYGQRVGNEISMRSVLIRAVFENSANNTAPVYVRFGVGIDLENSGTIPTLAEVLESTNAAGTAPTVLSPRNVSTTRGRFKILWDTQFVLGPATVVASIPAGTMQMNAADNSRKIIQKRVQLHSKQMYSGILAANYAMNTPFWYAISSAAAPNDPVMAIQSRLAYHD